MSAHGNQQLVIFKLNVTEKSFSTKPAFISDDIVGRTCFCYTLLLRVECVGVASAERHCMITFHILELFYR